MPRRRRHLVPILVAVVAVVALGLTTVAVVVGRESSEAASATMPSLQLGPQGLVGQFVVKCGYSHTAGEDPIVHFGMAGMSHSHDFFGNVATDASSTVDSLLLTDTTCNHRLDTAAYWAPTLYDHGVAVRPLGLLAYYRPAPGVDPTTLEPFPPGLKMLAGDPVAQGPQPVQHAAWTCGSSIDLRATPPDCPASAPLHNRLTFADCWDGESVDSPDHRSHVAFSAAGRCPSSHPVPMPQLTVSVAYPVSGSGHDLSLASGSTVTVHGDFLNAWDQPELTRQVELCLHRSLVCSVASTRADEEPFPSG